MSAVKSASTYVVLALEKVHNEAPATWQVIGASVVASSAEQAVRRQCEKDATTVPRVLVAVPERSWRPVTVTPKVATTLVIEEAQA